MITATGIKRILHTDVDEISKYFSTSVKDLTPEVVKALIAAAETAGNEVKNVHGETWTLDETEATVTGYKNQLTGQNYRYDTTPGELTPSFSIGQYDYATKAALLGGEVLKNGEKVIGWKRADGIVRIHKVLLCLTEDDVWFIFTNTQVVAREANTDKAIALAVKALVQTSEISGISSEYNYDASVVTAATAATKA